MVRALETIIWLLPAFNACVQFQLAPLHQGNQCFVKLRSSVGLAVILEIEGLSNQGSRAGRLSASVGGIVEMDISDCSSRIRYLNFETIPSIPDPTLSLCGGANAAKQVLSCERETLLNVHVVPELVMDDAA